MMDTNKEDVLNELARRVEDLKRKETHDK